MIIKRSFGFWLVYVCLIPILLGQSANIRVSHFGLDDGLSHRLITRIEKDSAGFLWLATPNGLNRFDGYNFLHFASGESSEFPISGDYIGEIESVEQGYFLITYKENLTNFDFLDPVTFKVRPILFKEFLGETSIVLNVFAERNGLVYILWRKGDNYAISSINVKGEFKKIYDLPSVNHQWGDKITLTKRKNGDFYLFNCSHGLFKQNDKGLTPVTIDKISFDPDTPLSLNFLKEDKQNRFWLSITNENGVFRFNETTKQFESFNSIIENKYIPRLWEDKEGNIIFGESEPALHPSFTKFYLLDLDNQWIDVSYFKNLGQFIVELESDNFFKTVFFATVSGFKIAVNKSFTIKNILHEQTEDQEQGKVIRGMVHVDNNRLIAADEDGVWYEIDKTRDTVFAVSLTDKWTRAKIKPTCSRELYYDDEKNRLWGFICNPNGKGSWLLQVNPDNWEAERFYFEEKIVSFCQTDGGLFLTVVSNNGSDSEVFYFNSITNEITPFRTKEGINPFLGTTAQFIQQSKYGYLWIGTLSGLYRVDVAANTVDLYDQTSGVSSNHIETILEINNHELLVGTNKGFDIFDYSINKKRNYNKKDGLSSNQIYGIISGKESDTYWISTILGLNFFNKNTGTFFNFFERDGLSNNEFNRFSHYRDKDGYLYFGGINGLNIFKEDDLLKIAPAPKVLLTKLQYFDSKNHETTVRQTELAELKKIRLQPNDKYLELFFSLPEYSDPENNQFQYKLEGYDEDWNLLGTNNRILFNSLPPKNYKLLVKGASSKGNWSSENFELNINVEQVFYKKWKFWVLCTILLGVFLQLINQYLFNQKLKVERIRTKLSSDLHDEVSGLLSGIAMQSELLEMVTSDEKSKDKLKKITQTSRSAMSRMGDVIWSIDSRKDTIEDLLTRMSEHVMDILDPLGVAWKMEVINLNRDKKMPVLIRENLYFIFKEAINNIGKHAITDNVKIEIGNHKDQFVLSIYNNSVGEESNKKSQKTGQGTANMKMRAEKIEATLEKKVDKNGFTVLLKRKRFA